MCNNLVSKLAALNEESSPKEVILGGIFHNVVNSFTGCNLNGLPVQRTPFNLKTTIDKITTTKNSTKIQENLMSTQSHKKRAALPLSIVHAKRKLVIARVRAVVFSFRLPHKGHINCIQPANLEPISQQCRQTDRQRARDR